MAVGINELATLDFMLYPNPANDVLFIETGEIIGGFIVNIIDLTGRTVFTKELSSSTVKLELNVSTLNKGMYLVNLQTESATISKRIILQ